MPRYTVKQGDCVMNIAEANGFLWETIWNHQDNARLKELRKDPNILFPGDILVIPEITPRVESVPTDQRTSFVKKTNRVQVQLRLLDEKRRSRANVEYTATVDNVSLAGRSDGEGYLTLTVRPDSRELKLKVIEGSKTDEYTLPLGSIDPIDELSGVQQRLTNLGHSCTSEEGTLGELTRSAIRAFQKEMQLNPIGEIDDATRQKLKEIHGS